MNRTCLVALALTALSLPSVAATPQKWIRVSTTAGFSLDQPVGWARVGAAPDRVDIVSRNCQQAGVVICPGEAEISVRADSIVAKPKALRTTACWSLEEKTSESLQPAGQKIEASTLTCDIGPRRFTIIERHWKGDKRSAFYGRVAIRMAKSLRYPG